MTVQQLRYVVAVAEAGSITEAARQLFLSQPSLSSAIKEYGQERYEFYYNATGTHQILEDVKNRISELGVLYLSEENEAVLDKVLEEYGLVFVPLFYALPHVFLQKDHPLAGKAQVTLDDLAPYPRLNFVQGAYEAVYYAEELFSAVPADREIRVNDRGAVVNFMLGLNAYTISSGIFPKYLNGERIVAVPLAEQARMQIGYVLPEKQELSPLGQAYVDAMRRYAPDGHREKL